MHAAARGLLGAAERGRDLRVTNIQVLALHQGNALFGREALDEDLDVAEQVSGVEPSVVVPACGRNAFQTLLGVQGAQARRLPLIAQECIRNDTVEPCAMVGVTG
jgi:hypothetical protein